MPDFEWWHTFRFTAKVEQRACENPGLVVVPLREKPGLLPPIAAGWWPFEVQKEAFPPSKAGISFVKKIFIIYNGLQRI
jgi:hypothetical protein